MLVFPQVYMVDLLFYIPVPYLSLDFGLHLHLQLTVYLTFLQNGFTFTNVEEGLNSLLFLEVNYQP